MIFPLRIFSDQIKFLNFVASAVIYIYVEQANVALNVAQFMHQG